MVIPFSGRLFVNLWSEGTTKARRRQRVSTFDIVIPKKTIFRVPILIKKSGTKRHSMTMTIGMDHCLHSVHSLQDKHNDRQLYTFCMTYIRIIVAKILHFTFYMQCVLALKS